MVNLASQRGFLVLTAINWRRVFVRVLRTHRPARKSTAGVRLPEAVRPNYRLFRCHRYDICGSTTLRLWLGSGACAIKDVAVKSTITRLI
jgi:hypothetical protein